MTENMAGDEPGRESEPMLRLRIGDIVTVFSAPSDRLLVSQGDVSGDGLFDAVRLYDNDTRTSALPGTVEVSNVSGVVGRMEPGAAVDLMIASTLGVRDDPALEARLREIMDERLSQEQEGA